MVQTESGATPIPNPNRAIVAAQNAERIAQRRSVATLAADVARTSSRSLQRGARRQVGGTFEALQALPPATLSTPSFGLSSDDARRLISAFQFAPSREVLSEARSTVIGSKSSFRFQDIQSILERARRGGRLIGGSRSRGGMFRNIIFSPSF